MPYKDNGGEFVESELGEIPVSWMIDKFSTIINITSGKSIKDKNMSQNSEYCYKLIGASKVIAYTKDFNIEDKILIIGRVGTLGIVQRSNERVWVSDNTLIIRSVFYEYVNNILHHIDYRNLNRGSTQPLITQSDIKQINVIIPPEELLLKFEGFVSTLLDYCDKNNKENEVFQNLRNLLLNKLMSGKIDVDDLDINWDKLDKVLKEVE